MRTSAYLPCTLSGTKSMVRPPCQRGRTLLRSHEENASRHQSGTQEATPLQRRDSRAELKEQDERAARRRPNTIGVNPSPTKTPGQNRETLG